MGYRSDIKAVFYTKKVDEWPMLRLFVDENFPEEWKDNLEVIGSTVYSGFVFSVGDVKWYDSFPGVKAFNAFVEKYTNLINEEDAPPWAYEFMRVGEDYEDVESDREGDYDHVLQMTREITCDF